VNHNSTPSWIYLGRIAASVALSAIIAFFWISDVKNRPTVTSSPKTYKMGSFLGDRLTKRTLVVFWATWCQNCKEDLVKLKDLKDVTEDKGFSVVAINADKIDMVTKAKEIWSETGFNSEFIHDQDGKWLNQLSIDALPTYFLFDEDCGAILRFDGQVDWDDEKIIKLVFE